MEYRIKEASFALLHNGKSILEISEESPCLFIGQGEESVEMYRGNFKISDYLIKRCPLALTKVTEAGAGVILLDFEETIRMRVELTEEMCQLRFEALKAAGNRFWLRLRSDAREAFYGCGEQMSYFNLKGRNFPLWTSEPGVGRDKSTYITWMRVSLIQVI